MHALVAPGKLEEDDASSIQPRLRVRTEDFVTAAVRTAIQANSTHRYTAKSLGLIRDRTLVGFGTTWLTPVYKETGRAARDRARNPPLTKRKISLPESCQARVANDDAVAAPGEVAQGQVRLFLAP